MARSNKTSSTRETSRLGMTATQLLKKDHATVKALFQRYEKAGDRALETKQKLFTEIERELETHATIEEEIFYPAVQQGISEAQDLVKEAIEEHSVVKLLLRELGGMSPDDEEYDPKMKVLQENVEHHIEEEEGEMFPKTEQRLGDERLQQLGSEMQARKEALAQPALKRLMSGVSGLIFGNGGAEDEAQEPSGEPRGQRRGTKAAPSRQGGRGRDGARGEGQGGRSGKRGTAKKRQTGARAQARKRASAMKKKRSSGRAAEAKGGRGRSSAQKRGAAATARARGRSGAARKTSRKR